jgi:hypothetical protein
LALRRYLLSGGFHGGRFGGRVNQNLYDEMKRVFSGRTAGTAGGPIFHCVFDLKEKPQIPTSDRQASRGNGITWERNVVYAHYRHLRRQGRMMVMICHNTDLATAGTKCLRILLPRISEKKSYPLGINIVFYAMTH